MPRTLSISTMHEGASLVARNFRVEWMELGTTPVERRVPRVPLRIQVQKAGYEPVDRILNNPGPAPAVQMSIDLVAEGTRSTGNGCAPAR